MEKAKLQIIVWFFLTITTIVTYKIITRHLDKPVPEILQARVSLELEQINLEKARITQLEHDKLNLQRSHLKRNADLWFYGSVGVLSAISLSVIIVAAGLHRERVKRASVHTYRIGSSEVVVHERDLSLAWPIATGLMNAEKLEKMHGGLEKAFQIYTTMAEVQSKQIRALMGRKGMTLTENQPESELQNALPAAGNLTFTELLNNEMIAPGKPLILGFHHGQAEYRDMKALKSLAIAGWQGSGKTVSMGYLIASTLLAYGARIFVIDPHKGHDEGLYALIKPLEKTGLVNIINPFDTPQLIGNLNATLDRRLTGDESSSQAILLVIDELARLAETDSFDALVKLLDRCTQETRKANITFIGGSQKWTARHFKGRADIRACMNSALVHKTKPSQADLLLEDSQEKKLVKQLQQPGDAILVTDFADARLVRMPFCSRSDMEMIAEMVGNHKEVITISSPEPKYATPEGKTEVEIEAPALVTPTLTPAMLQAKLLEGWKQREIERRTGINQSKISNFKNGNERALTEEEQHLIFDLLFPKDEKTGAPDGNNQNDAPPTLPENQLIQ